MNLSVDEKSIMTPERYYYLKFKKFFDLKIKKYLGILIILFFNLFYKERFMHVGNVLLVFMTCLGILLIVNGIRDEIIQALNQKDDQDE